MNATIVDLVEQLKQLLAKHGFKDREIAQLNLVLGDNKPKTVQEQFNDHRIALAKLIIDKRTFVAECVAILGEAEEEADRQHMLLSEATALADVAIDGDKATGIIKHASDNHLQDVPVVFTKIDGEWKLQEAPGLVDR